MPNNTILVIEDEDDIAELVTYNLAKEGYQPLRAASGEEGLRMINQRPPQLVILDLMLPGLDGLDVLKQLRSRRGRTSLPVIILSAKGEEADVVIGLELGADDYVIKPFSPRVLAAKVKAVLRRDAGTSAAADDSIRLGELMIHAGRREVFVEGHPVALTRQEFGMLHLLASRPGWVFTRNQILDTTRGEDVMVTDRAVDVQIVALRKKLGPAGKYIETIRGIGYRCKG